MSLTRYGTMTPSGMHGHFIDAVDDEAAVIEARRRGYKPVEVIEYNDELLIIVED